MMRRAAAYLVASLVLAVSCAGIAFATYTVLQIIVSRSNPEPRRPSAPVNTLQELSAALADCWSPPPLDDRHGPVDLTFQVSFKRSGELFGKPRAILFSRALTDEERQHYYTAVAQAVDRCSHMPFTEAMGAAAAGRLFRVNFQDRRNTRKARVPWQIQRS